MFTVDRGSRHPATFRLQLFTAPRGRPVAVVIQWAGEGVGLINEGERYAEAVWLRHCPAEPGPPVWIERLLLPSRDRCSRSEPARRGRATTTGRGSPPPHRATTCSSAARSATRQAGSYGSPTSPQQLHGQRFHEVPDSF